MTTTGHSDVHDQFDSIVDNLSLFKIQIGVIQQQIRAIEKNINKQVKGLQKDALKRASKGKRKPSGFAKPAKVTKELCEFMNKEEGTEIARTDVTRALVSYIKENNLENKNNSKVISPDSKLKYLLGISEDEELTYFNMQKYMNKHFVSTTVE